jgi:hypothetical protein
MANKVQIKDRVARVDDILNFLGFTLVTFEAVLQTLEEAELYEECAEILDDIHDIKDEIKKYEHYKLIEQHTGRRIAVTKIPDFGLPNNNKTE